MTSSAAEPGLAVYIHWPFCLKKCPYCDFNSHVRETVDEAAWQAAYLTELSHYAALTPGRRVDSVFFGGGTPSLMNPKTVAAILEAIDGHWSLEPQAEITLEANPTSAEAERFRDFATAGVNRLSIGVQSLDDEALAFLGRQHDAKEALAAVALARAAVPRLSFDMIYARPGQTPKTWEAELRRALAEAPEHLSLYQLTIEPGTVFEGRHRRGELAMPDDSIAAVLFEITQALAGEAGLSAYEVSNHAQPGGEARHNLAYWRYQDYLGIGPGAHGRITVDGEKRATRQHRAPEAWLQGVERDGHATRETRPLARGERLAEMTMMGLRLSEGITRTAYRRELAGEPETLYPADRLRSLIEEGLVVLDDRGLRATTEGRLRLNGLIAYLLN